MFRVEVFMGDERKELPTNGSTSVAIGFKKLPPETATLRL
jgi:hypothetical protein